jgi:hypothetical protein
MRKKQQEGKIGGWRRNSRKGRLVDEEETAGRKDWWMKKKQQEGKIGGWRRNSRKGRLVYEEGYSRKGRLVYEEGIAGSEGCWMRKEAGR